MRSRRQFLSAVPPIVVIGAIVFANGIERRFLVEMSFPKPTMYCDANGWPLICATRKVTEKSPDGLGSPPQFTLSSRELHATPVLANVLINTYLVLSVALMTVRCTSSRFRFDVVSLFCLTATAAIMIPMLLNDYNLFTRLIGVLTNFTPSTYVRPSLLTLWISVPIYVGIACGMYLAIATFLRHFFGRAIGSWGRSKQSQKREPRDATERRSRAF